MKDRIGQIRSAIGEMGFDGWLFCDFHNRDHLGLRVLGLDPEKMTTRRWYYFIPVEGEPEKLVHKIEPGRLDSLPGAKRSYLSWQELHEGLKGILGKAGRVAMQYSPMNAVPYVSLVDAGTVDLVRSFGVEVVSSADLVQMFDSCLDARDFEMHLEASQKVHAILDEAFAFIGERVTAGETVTEWETQRLIMKRFEEEGLTSDGAPPIVAVNEHSGDPHFEPAKENASPIERGDFVLIDLWARKNVPGGIYFDITWCGCVDGEVSPRHEEIFQIVRAGRDAGVGLIEERFADGKPLSGWEVDDAVRGVIAGAGYGDYFIHRTGHSIGTEDHGTGVNIDNLETKDERRILRGTCFSIEPGIYLAEFGVRSEIDVFVSAEGEVMVTGPRQETLRAIL